MVKTTTRNVRKRNTNFNLSTGYAKTSRKVSIVQIKATTKKLQKTRTRRFILYSVVCILLMQIIKFLVYELIYPGSPTPSGFVFLLIIYIQTGLMIAAFGFIIAASISYLHSISKS